MLKPFEFKLLKARAQKAFTLVEILIVTSMVAIITVSIAISLPESRKRSRFEDNHLKIVNLIQQARGLSLSTKLIDGGTGNLRKVDRYVLDVHSDFVRLFASAREGVDDQVDEEGVNDRVYEEIERHTLDEELYITNLQNGTCTGPCITVFYILPDGQVCFSEDCQDESASARSFLLHSEENKYVNHYEIDIVGGFPEVVAQFNPSNPFNPLLYPAGTRELDECDLNPFAVGCDGGFGGFRGFGTGGGMTTP